MSLFSIPLFSPRLALLLALLLLNPFVCVADKPNRLQFEQSPYLQQHAHNPVDWFPWGEEAFSKARKEGKLIFLSIGYSTCHWCHVMEAESFADRQVAALLNRDYVAIKVDREERPDIDQLYMQICTEMTGSGGWPLTIIMTADKIPIFAGTYFPKQRRYNRPGMLDLLPQVIKLWQDNPDYLLKNASRALDQLQKKQSSTDRSKQLSTAHIEQAVSELTRSFDPDKGGFGQAPKFPRPHLLSFLLQRHYRNKDPQLLRMVEKTLQAMRFGGIYDQLGFGFHRYSTDADWLVPHFEKMLYDQAGLARVYLEAFQLTGKNEYADTAREIFVYLQQRLRDPSGGFYTAEDADSEGVEGKFYLWQSKQIDSLLGTERAERFKQIFNVDQFGNFAAHIPDEEPGTNILHLLKPLYAWAAELKIPLAKLRSQLEEDRQKLLAAREQRVHPFRDDKILSGWNGLTISALALGARALNDPELLQQAESAAHFIEQQLQTEDGHLLRRWRNGIAEIDAFARDYAFVARGLLDLYRSSYNPQYLQNAIVLGEILRQEFSDKNGQLFETPAANELPLRTRELYDGALPSSGSVALELYARLYLLTGNKNWNRYADELLQASAAQVNRYAAGYTQFLTAASLLLESTRELVIVGDPEKADTKALLATVQTSYRPDTSILLRSPENSRVTDQLAPYSVEMSQLGTRATAYMCQNFACQRPQTEPTALQKLLQQTD